MMPVQRPSTPTPQAGEVPVSAGTSDAVDPPDVIGLTVLYDEHCGLCLRIKAWMAHQPTAVPMRLLAAGSDQARAEYGAIPALGEDLVVVSTEGAVWWGPPGAYLMCLWGLQRWRPLAHRLAQPRWQPYAESMFRHVAIRRRRISAILSAHECETCTAPHLAG
jgi:predicted DCC family thiol-disulfide oxidoreductase YuxK